MFRRLLAVLFTGFFTFLKFVYFDSETSNSDRKKKFEEETIDTFPPG